MSSAPVGPTQTRNCVSCGRSIAFDANVCQYCGHDYRVAAAPPKHEKGMLSMVGGILILIAGLMGLVMGGLLLAIDVNDLDDFGISGVGDAFDTLENILTVCGLIFVIMGLIAVIGGFFGVQRKKFGIVILGGVLGLFCFGPYMLGSILALVGLILVAMAKKDFD